MNFAAILEATPEGRVAKHMQFETLLEAQEHVAFWKGLFPSSKAFAVAAPAAPLTHWLVDMVAKTVVIDVPPPPDLGAIDRATVDALLLESGVMRAFALMMFEIGKAGKTGDWSFFDGVTDQATYKTLLLSMIR